MIPSAGPLLAPRALHPPLVLVVDDDARVVELLQIALSANHFRVITAADGDEAIRRALADRPDIVVLDVRLPRKGGLEVTDFLRHDPDDPHVPVVLVSASADTEARLEGLARGADDFLVKPFSPRELVARMQRLLARAGETRDARRRAAELEHELGRARNESQRAGQEVRREQRLRELAYGTGRDLLRLLDPDEVADRLLLAVRRQLATGAVALLAPEEGAAARFAPRAAHGDAAGRFEELSLPQEAELVALLAGLGRPAGCQELQRFPELRAGMSAFVAAGAAWIAPLCGPHGLEALLVAGERTDGAPLAPAEQEAFGALCDFAAIALHNARRYVASQDRALALLAARAQSSGRVREATAEALEFAARAGDVARLPAAERALLAHVVALGPWAWGEEGRVALADLARDDPTRRMRALVERIGQAESLDAPGGGPAAERQCGLIAGVCVRFLVARAGGRSAGESRDGAISWVGGQLDPALRGALEAAFTGARASRTAGRAA